MGLLDRFERRLDRLVNGAFAKAFKAEVEPVEIAAALQRECDDRAAIVARGRALVPNEFVVELARTDHERLETYAQPLGNELAAMVREHADAQGYSFVGPVSVRFAEADDLDTGMFRVKGEAVSGRVPDSTGTTGPTPVAASANARVEAAGVPYPLTRRRTVLGRASDADLRLADPGVSRRHAEIVLSDPPRITDLGSTNGTWLDGERVAGAELYDGARLRLGQTELVFRIG